MEIKQGKIKDLGKNTKGWVIGNFVDKNSPFNSGKQPPAYAGGCLQGILSKPNFLNCSSFAPVRIIFVFGNSSSIFRIGSKISKPFSVSITNPSIASTKIVFI